MRVTTALISPEGTWLPASGMALHQALGYPDPDFDAAGFAVRNLGYIKLEMIEDALLDIECHPQHVSPAALAAVQRHLESSGQRLFRLRYLAEDWRTEVIVSPTLASRRLSELCTTDMHQNASGRFRATELDLSQLSGAGDDDRRRALLQKWRASFGRFDDTVLPFAFKHGLAASMVLTSVKPHQPDPIFRYIGESFWGWGQDFYIIAVGDRVENQPDKDYGEWVSRFYCDVATSNRPRYDRVDAYIKKSARGEEYSYERLMLPWSTGSGEVLITLSSRILSGDPPRAPDGKWRVAKVKRSS
jgi:hypothetical protein